MASWRRTRLRNLKLGDICKMPAGNIEYRVTVINSNGYILTTSGGSYHYHRNKEVLVPQPTLGDLAVGDRFALPNTRTVYTVRGKGPRFSNVESDGTPYEWPNQLFVHRCELRLEHLKPGDHFTFPDSTTVWALIASDGTARGPKGDIYQFGSLLRVVRAPALTLGDLAVGEKFTINNFVYKVVSKSALTSRIYRLDNGDYRDWANSTPVKRVATTVGDLKPGDRFTQGGEPHSVVGPFVQVTDRQNKPHYLKPDTAVQPYGVGTLGSIPVGANVKVIDLPDVGVVKEQRHPWTFVTYRGVTHQWPASTPASYA